jgi:hypothetical protein
VGGLREKKRSHTLAAKLAKYSTTTAWKEKRSVLEGEVATETEREDVSIQLIAL